MRLLICTQTVDRTDPALGFFHRWIEELSVQCESVVVVCLKEGNHTFPSNVEVLSLGKEAGTPRLTKIIRFYRYIFSNKNGYDTVLVHMNQEYVLMGGLFWKLMGKKVFMWRNHYKGSVFTDLAAAFCTKIFSTSKFSYTAKFKKTVLMPVGVDIDSANLNIPVERVPRSILFLARLDDSKRPDLLIQALGILARHDVQFTATIAGGPSDARSDYLERLRALAEKEGVAAHIKFVGAVPNPDTFRYYRSHEIFVNCSRSGMLDKTMFKAVACGCLVATASRDFAAMVEDPRFIFPEGDAPALAERLVGLLGLSHEQREVAEVHLQKILAQQSLPALMVQLSHEMRTPAA